jgi:hypothetical protein
MSSPALEAAAGWWRRGAQQKNRGLARRLRALVRRRPWLELLHLRSGHARRPFLRRPHLQAGRRRGGPAARRPRLLHGRPPALLFLAPSFFPSPPLFLRWTGRNPHGVAVDLGEKSPRQRSTGRTGAVGLIGRLLGFRGSRAGSEDAVQGHAAASGGQRGGHGGRRGLRRPLPHAPTVRHGEDGRAKGIEGLTGGSQLAERQEVEDGPAVRWAERARWAGGSGGLGVLERT